MTTHVYTLAEPNGNFLYVGHTLDVEQRLRQHRREVWGPRISTVWSDSFDSKTEALAFERNLIADLEPDFNIQGNPLHMTWDEFLDWSGISDEIERVKAGVAA